MFSSDKDIYLGFGGIRLGFYRTKNKVLTLSTLGVNSADDNLMIFSHVSQKIGFDSS